MKPSTKRSILLATLLLAAILLVLYLAAWIRDTEPSDMAGPGAAAPEPEAVPHPPTEGAAAEQHIILGLSGVVLDERDNPVKFGHVTLSMSDFGEGGPHVTRADETGAFAFHLPLPWPEDQATARATLAATAPDFQEARVDLDVPREGLRDVVLRLKILRAHLDGVLLDENAKPLPVSSNCSLFLREIDAEGGRTKAEESWPFSAPDEKGSFSIDDIYPGAYRIFVSVYRSDSQNLPPSPSEITLKPGEEIHGLEVRVPFATEPGSVGGYLFDELGNELRRAEVIVTAEGYRQEVVCVSDNYFKVGDIPSDITEVSVVVSHSECETGEFVSPVGSIVSEYVLALNAPAQLQLSVVDAGNGMPVADPEARLQPPRLVVGWEGHDPHPTYAKGELLFEGLRVGGYYRGTADGKGYCPRDFDVQIDRPRAFYRVELFPRAEIHIRAQVREPLLGYFKGDGGLLDNPEQIKPLLTPLGDVGEPANVPSYLSSNPRELQDEGVFVLPVEAERHYRAGLNWQIASQGRVWQMTDVVLNDVQVTAGGIGEIGFEIGGTCVLKAPKSEGAGGWYICLRRDAKTLPSVVGIENINLVGSMRERHKVWADSAGVYTVRGLHPGTYNVEYPLAVQDGEPEYLSKTVTFSRENQEITLSLR